MNHILRRAIALDADAADRMPIARLRSLAQEIGISDHALDAALAEFDRQGASVSASHPVATAPTGRWRISIVRNAAVLAGASIGLAVLGPAFEILRVPNFARSAVLVLAFVLIATVARRIGARLVQHSALGLLVALVVELVTAFRVSWQLHGAKAQLVVMATAVAGVVVGAIATRRGAGAGAGAERDDCDARLGTPLRKVGRRLTATLRRLGLFGMSMGRALSRPAVSPRLRSSTRHVNHAPANAA